MRTNGLLSVCSNASFGLPPLRRRKNAGGGTGPSAQGGVEDRHRVGKRHHPLGRGQNGPLNSDGACPDN